MKVLNYIRNKKTILWIIAINPIFDILYNLTSKFINLGYGQFSISQIFRILFLLILILNIKEIKTFLKNFFIIDHQTHLLYCSNL